MQIKPYNCSALSAIVSLSIRAWTPVFESMQKVMDPQVFKHFYPNWKENQSKAVEAACLAADTEVWTAGDEGSIVGFVAVKLHQEFSMGEIYMVAVDPDYQCNGIGSALIDRATNGMRGSGMSVVMAETGGDPGHAPARHTYERLGFKHFSVARYFMKL